VGVEVGGEIGSSEGSDVGKEVGFGLGLGTGCEVGACEGFSLGLGVGHVVGSCVSRHHTPAPKSQSASQLSLSVCSRQYADAFSTPLSSSSVQNGSP